jgi:hypothetical protein
VVDVSFAADRMVGACERGVGGVDTDVWEEVCDDFEVLEDAPDGHFSAMPSEIGAWSALSSAQNTIPQIYGAQIIN